MGASAILQSIRFVKTENIKQIICDKFGPYCEQAIAIAECESGLDPHSINYNDARITGFNSWGLFMHNEPSFKGWDDPAVSTEKAWAKFSNRGWWPWTNCARKLGLV